MERLTLTGMKRCVWMVGVVMALVGCKGKPAESGGSASVPQAVTNSGSATSPVATPASQPAVTPHPTEPSSSAKGGLQWGWKTYDEENFTTQPSQGRVFSVPENATKLRVRLRASMPVDAAAMTRDVFKSAKGVVREDRLVKLPCASIGVREDEAACELNAKESVVYVVRDRRALSGDPAAMALLKQRDGRVLATLPADKVHVSLAVWACVANCASTGVPAGGPAQ